VSWFNKRGKQFGEWPHRLFRNKIGSALHSPWFDPRHNQINFPLSAGGDLDIRYITEFRGPTWVCPQTPSRSGRPNTQKHRPRYVRQVQKRAAFTHWLREMRLKSAHRQQNLSSWASTRLQEPFDTRWITAGRFFKLFNSRDTAKTKPNTVLDALYKSTGI